jgi:arylsulfatase A-like enzyme
MGKPTPSGMVYAGRAMAPARRARPNLVVILIDDLRFDETAITGHPYMKSPNIDRLAREGAMFLNAFHTTPLCSPNRASIVTGQYASRHGVFDNIGRDALSHRLPNYHRPLQALGYETAHIGKWHMGNDARPRPGYDTWISFRGQGTIVDPVLWEDGEERTVPGYVTDLLSARAVDFVDRARSQPFALFLSHKAVHPDVQQRQDGTLDMTTMRGYIVPDRHRDLYRDGHYPMRPSVRPLDEVVADKPAWREVFEQRDALRARQPAAAVVGSASQEEIRQRAAMMASVDEGVGALLEALERRGTLDDTLILFLGDNGFFFGEHGLQAERRFAYEEGIRTPFFVRYPPLARPGTTLEPMVLALDIAPTMLELAGGTPAPHIQGRSLVPLLRGRARRWRTSFLVEYFNESAFPWLVGMSYKAVRTERHKLIHWIHKDGVDELYDLEQDPYEMTNVIADPAQAATVTRLRRELRTLVADAVGL